MSDLPTPVTRQEQYLNAAANGDPNDLPIPITREEQYLKAIAENSGGGGGTGEVTGVKGDAESTYRKGKVNLTPANIGTYSSSEIDSKLSDKQNELTAGDNITIEEDAQTGNLVISATGGGGGGGDVTGVKGSAESTYRTGNVTISPANIGVEAGAQVNVQSNWNQADNTQDDFIKNKPTLGTASAKNSTSAVTANNTDLVESGAVKSAIDTAMVSAYKPGGSKTCAELTSSLLIADNDGMVYAISDTGTTTADFIEGAGKEIGVGSDVGVIKVGNAYKFNLLPGFIDTSGFVNKSATAGLLKNDGSVDTTQYLSQHQDISGKADKVSGATSGNFAGLDANGNLTDSGSKASDFLTQHQDITGKQNKTLDTPLTIDGTQRTTVEAALGALNNGHGVMVSSTVSDDSVSFTNVAIGNTSIIDGPYVQDLLMDIDSVSVSGTTVTYTFTDDTADGKTAYIWIRSLS